MINYQSILVVASANHEAQPALARAFDLIRLNTGATKITFFLAIYDFSYDMTSMLSSDERNAMRNGVIEQRKNWLKEIAAPYLIDNVEFEIKVVWHHRPYEAIIKEVFTSKHDIVIKTTRKHDTLGSVFFTPTDWHLLRKCPTPLLLVKDHDWPKQNGNILTAVHVGSENETHLELNEKMVKLGQNFAQRLNGNLHLVNTYPVTPANVTVELPEFDPSVYTDAVRGYHLTQMKTLRQKFGISEENTIVQEGLPEEVIPKISTKLDAHLLVLGTTGRTGLSAVFIGNTAEHVIDKMDCDVLAIKPPGFISTLDPDPSI